MTEGREQERSKVVTGSESMAKDDIRPDCAEISRCTDANHCDLLCVSKISEMTTYLSIMLKNGSIYHSSPLFSPHKSCKTATAGIMHTHSGQ